VVIFFRKVTVAKADTRAVALPTPSNARLINLTPIAGLPSGAHIAIRRNHPPGKIQTFAGRLDPSELNISIN
jgi:hypothetical protein